MQECTFQPKIARAIGKYTLDQAAEVKQNASSILREDNLLKKKQKDQYEILKEYESGMLDASTYFKWQYEAKQQDDIEEKCRIEQSEGGGKNQISFYLGEVLDRAE
jgi:hypothetical protein